MDTIFYNSDYIVIEYIDLIKSPYLLLLDFVRKSEKMGEIFKTENIKYLDDEGISEWYVNRKHQNIFGDLNRFPDKISNADLDTILEQNMNITPLLYTNSKVLILDDMLKTVTSKKVTNDILIYHPHANDFAKKDLDDIYDYNFNFYTDFNEIIDKAGANSTYFLSDINKINMLKEKGCLKFSSVTLPIEYRYNKVNMTDFNIDLKELLKTDTFKLTYMNACSYTEQDIFKDDISTTDEDNVKDE